MNPILENIVDLAQSAALVATSFLLYSTAKTLKAALSQNQAANREILQRLQTVEALLNQDIAQSFKNHTTLKDN